MAANGENATRRRRRLSVFLYIPNIIGYIRIILTILAFSRWQDYKYFNALYFTGFILDGADGLAARYFNQSSEFGAILDMLTDRCATSALLSVLSHLYPPYASYFIALVFLDGYSHWLQMASGLCAGASSHKQATGHSFLLRLYYSRAILTFVCFFTELFFLMLYTAYFTRGPVVSVGKWNISIVEALAWISAPTFLLKQLINGRQIMISHSLILKSTLPSHPS